MEPTHERPLNDLLSKYGEAWNDHDLDAVMALHAENGVFQLHAGNPPAAEGIHAVREAFAHSLAQWPDIHFHADDVRLGQRHATVRWTVTATLAAPLTIAGEPSSPSGRPVRFDALDVLVWTDGRISRKDTYIDVIGLQSQLADTAAG